MEDILDCSTGHDRRRKLGRRSSSTDYAYRNQSRVGDKEMCMQLVQVPKLKNTDTSLIFSSFQLLIFSAGAGERHFQRTGKCTRDINSHNVRYRTKCTVHEIRYGRSGGQAQPCAFLYCFGLFNPSCTTRHIAMARHNKTHSDFSIPRSSTTRIFAILTLALPVIFYLLSLAFALKTIYEPAYAESVVYDDVPEIANATNTTTPLTQKSSPFYSWYVSHNSTFVTY